jgi:hypothetical protein
MVSENANTIKPHYHSEINTALGVSAQEERLKSYNTQKYGKLRCVHQLHQAVASTKNPNKTLLPSNNNKKRKTSKNHEPTQKKAEEISKHPARLSCVALSLTPKLNIHMGKHRQISRVNQSTRLQSDLLPVPHPFYN